jgi:hypothetical protein
MKTKQSTGIDKQLDDAWSLLVKLMAGNQCEYCGKQGLLNSHHVFSRSKKSTRWSLPNGICLCVGHHTFSSSFSAHKTPTEFTEWIKEKRGEDWYVRLRISAHSISKLHPFEKEVLLKDLQEQIKAIKGKNNVGTPIEVVK